METQASVADLKNNRLVWPEPGATQPTRSNSGRVQGLESELRKRFAETTLHPDDCAQHDPATGDLLDPGKPTEEARSVKISRVHLFVEAEHDPKVGWNTAPGKRDEKRGVDGPSAHEQAIADVCSRVGCSFTVVARYAHGVEVVFTRELAK